MFINCSTYKFIWNCTIKKFYSLSLYDYKFCLSRVLHKYSIIDNFIQKKNLLEDIFLFFVRINHRLFLGQNWCSGLIDKITGNSVIKNKTNEKSNGNSKEARDTVTYEGPGAAFIVGYSHHFSNEQNGLHAKYKVQCKDMSNDNHSTYNISTTGLPCYTAYD